MSNGLIFISYRREDAAGYTRAIYDQVVQHFSKERVFMDVDAIEPGLPFDEAIEKAIGQCEILLAVIGQNWLAQRAGAGPRINDPKDYVRLEIAAALSRNVRVLPVLLEGAKMPSEEELPEDLRELSLRRAVDVSHSSFRSDVENLILAVRRALGERVVPSQPPGRPSMIYWLAGALAICVLGLAYLQLKQNPPVPASGETNRTTPPKITKSPGVLPQPSGKENEPNDTAPSANTIVFGSKVQGVVEKETGDFFTFTIPGDFQGKTRVILRKLTSDGFSAVVTLYDKNEQRLMSADESWDTTVSMVFDSTPNSTYFVRVKGSSTFPLPSNTGPYELEIRAD